MFSRGFAVLLAGASLAVGQSGLAGAGHWEGTIRLPNKTVRVNVDVARNDKQQWIGSLAMPELAFTPIVFGDVAIDGSAVTLSSRESMLQIEGTISADGKSIKGGFVSAFLLAVPVAIELRRTAEPQVAVAISSGPISSEAEGTWTGNLTLKTSWEDNDQRTGTPTPVRITLGHAADGNASGAFDKLPLSSIRQQGTHLQFEAKGASAVFVGEIEGDELTGQWTQFDADPVALVLHRAQ